MNLKIGDKYDSSRSINGKSRAQGKNLSSIRSHRRQHSGAGEKIVEVEVSASVKEYYRPLANGYGTVWNSGSMPFIDENGNFVIEGPAKIITSITRIEEVENTDNYSDADKNMKVNFEEVVCMEKSNISKDSIYGPSVTFFPVSENWKEKIVDGSFALVSNKIYDTTL